MVQILDYNFIPTFKITGTLNWTGKITLKILASFETTFPANPCTITV